MTATVRAGTPADLDAVFDVRAQAFAVREADRSRFVATTPTDGLIVAESSGDGIVGALLVWPLGQYLGGRRVPMGGVATVVVRPEWRGRGVAAAMLTAALEHMRERGLAVSVLHPATLRPYRRAGWELTGDRPRTRIPTRSLAAMAPGEPERLRRLGPDDLDAMRVCYDRVAPARHGWLDRSEDFWRAVAARSFGDLAYAYGLEGEDGTLRAYCRYRLVDDDVPGHRLIVDDLVADDPVGELTIWGFLGGHGMQVRAVEVEGPPVDAVAYALGEQVARREPSLRWMGRVVHVGAALTARGYPPDARGAVHLSVSDPAAPWNDGPWILEVEDGRGSVRPGGTGELRTGPRGLAALVIGAAPAGTLLRAGLLHGGGPEARARLDAWFAGSEPTMPDHF